MNSTSFSNHSTVQTNHNEHLHYRSVSKSAVASIVFAVLGLTSFLSPTFVILPALGLGFALVSLINFYRYPDEIVGKLAAQVGLVVSAVCLVASVAHHVYVYNTEVPEGYSRISFSMLRDNPKTPARFAEAAPGLDGEKVFLKGYVRPGDKKNNLKNFILVGDFGDCCFGGNPKISEVVAIAITEEGKTVNHSYSLRRIGGTFRFLPQTALTDESDIPQVFYVIEADHVK